MRQGGLDSAPVLRQLLLTLPAAPGQFGARNVRNDAVWVPHPRPTLKQMAEAAGVSTRTIRRWKMGGRIPSVLADRVACRLGMHPSELFDEWYGQEKVG